MSFGQSGNAECDSGVGTPAFAFQHLFYKTCLCSTYYQKLHIYGNSVDCMQDGAVLPSSARESCPDQSCLSLANVGQGDGGLYQCRADNGVGEPDQATIALTVLCEYTRMSAALNNGNIPDKTSFQIK